MHISVVNEHVAQWGEGAIWIEDRLYYVDIEGKGLLSCKADGTDLKHLETGFKPATLVPRTKDGGFLCGGEGGIYAWDGEGIPEPLVNPEPDILEHRLNDGKCSPDGRFFVGSINQSRQPLAALYRLDPDMSLHPVLSGITNSNGLVWTSDGHTMFYIDTVTRCVTRFHYDEGNLSERAEAFPTTDYDASPDGMTIDSEGRLWIAMCHGGCVVCYSQEGRILEQIDLPCREVTSCAFGGKNLDRLFITTGRPGERIESLAGRLFAVDGLGVRGVPSNRFLS